MLIGRILIIFFVHKIKIFPKESLMIHYFILEITFIYTSTDNGILTHRAHKKTFHPELHPECFPLFDYSVSDRIATWRLIHPGCVSG